MKPFTRAYGIPKTDAQISAAARAWGVTEDSLRAAYARESAAEIWRNDLYQVTRETKEGGAVYLSIKRLDKSPARDWRHLQEIKNALIGPECEAVELFPAESRLVDTANQFHLWGSSDPTYRFPFGFTGPRNVRYESGHGARQRDKDEPL